jgi:hypothetical protein
MIRIVITPAAFDAIAATLPLGSVGYEAERDAQGNCFVWLDEGTVNKLGAMRGPGEGYSEVIIRLFVGRDADEAIDELMRIVGGK